MYFTRFPSYLTGGIGGFIAISIVFILLVLFILRRRRVYNRRVYITY